MDNKPSLSRLARKVCLLAFFGFLAVTLAGPVIAVVSVVLSFALIGFLFWLPIRLLLYGRHGAFREGVQTGRAVARCCGRGVRAAWCGTLRAGPGLHRALSGTASRLGVVLLETLSGALVGLLLVVAFAPNREPTAEAVSLGVLLGALAGVLVVVSRSRRSAEAEVGESPEVVS